MTKSADHDRCIMPIAAVARKCAPDGDPPPLSMLSFMESPSSLDSPALSALDWLSSVRSAFFLSRSRRNAAAASFSVCMMNLVATRSLQPSECTTSARGAMKTVQCKEKCALGLGARKLGFQLIQRDLRPRQHLLRVRARCLSKG